MLYRTGVYKAQKMTWGFLCWGETLVHTCIHLKSHWLYTLLSWCAYTKKKKKKGSNDLKHVLPWLQRRIGKITGWHGDGTGHVWVILQLLISKWEWFEQVWSNAAIWGCCQLEGVRAAPGFGGTWEKKPSDRSQLWYFVGQPSVALWPLAVGSTSFHLFNASGNILKKYPIPK